MPKIIANKYFNFMLALGFFKLENICFKGSVIVCFIYVYGMFMCLFAKKKHLLKVFNDTKNTILRGEHLKGIRERENMKN